MSSEDRMAMLMIKGTIAEMPPTDQAKVATIAEQLRAVLKDTGDVGFMALALVNAEQFVEDVPR